MSGMNTIGSQLAQYFFNRSAMIHKKRAVTLATDEKSSHDSVETQVVSCEHTI